MTSRSFKYWALLVFLAVPFIIFTNGILTKLDAGYCLIVVLMGIFFTFYDQQHSPSKDNWLSPSNFALIGLLIVSFQYIIDFLIGFRQLSDFVYPEGMRYTCYMVSMGVIAYLLGLSSVKNKTISINTATARHNRHIGILMLVVLQILFFAAWIYTVDFMKLVLGDLYLEEGFHDGSTIDSIFEELFNDVNIVLMATIIYNNKGIRISSLKDFFRQNYAISWIVILVYCIIRLLSGDRGPCIYTILLCLFTYIIVSEYRMKLVFVLLLFFVSSIIITMVGMARSIDTSATLSEKIHDSFFEFQSNQLGRFSEKTILNSTEELATSIQCNEYAVEEIQTGGPYHYGTYQFYQLVSCVPFVPSFISHTLKVPLANQSSSLLVTLRHSGRVDQYQIGTTNMADFFLDFGLIGMIICMILVGAFYGKMNVFVGNNSFTRPSWILLTLIYSSQSIYICRCGFLSLIKPFLILLVLFYINKILFSRNHQSYAKNSSLH